MALMIYFEFCFELNHPFLRLNSRRQRKKRGAELIEEMETVSRQGFWNQRQLKLIESSAHLVDCIMRRACGDASVALRVSFV